MQQTPQRPARTHLVQDQRDAFAHLRSCHRWGAFFPPMGFRHSAPRGDPRKRVLLVPARPMSSRLLRPASLTCAALKACGNALGGLGSPCQGGPRCLGSAMGESTVTLHHLLRLSIPRAPHHRHRLMAFLTLRGARPHRACDALDDQRACGAIASVAWRPRTPPGHRDVRVRRPPRTLPASTSAWPRRGPRCARRGICGSSITASQAHASRGGA